MRKFFTYLLLILILFAPLNAQESETEALKTTMVKISDNFYTILNDENNDEKMRQKKILKEVTYLFDFRLMSRLSLDKKTRSSITKTQFNDFTETFEKYIQNYYLDKLDLLKGTSATIKESKKTKNNRIEVTATLQTKTDVKKVIYKFYKNKKEEWLIYDLEIANVSILQSYRSQFSSYLTEHSFDELLTKLNNNNT
ncbi:MAG: ABC transporter substrate-binding protein [Campylobacterota bacterium]|nr:ABC transporter substrate-binding protein [Campylobacterota bacterium]